MGLRDWLDSVFVNTEESPDEDEGDAGEQRVSTETPTEQTERQLESAFTQVVPDIDSDTDSDDAESGFIFGDDLSRPKSQIKETDSGGRENQASEDATESDVSSEESDASAAESDVSSGGGGMNTMPDPGDAAGSSTRTRLIRELQRLEAEQGGDVIKSTRMNADGKYSVNEYTDEFGSWEDALGAANIDKRALLLEDLATVWRRLGCKPTTTEMDTYGQFSSGIHTTYFESWSEAVAQCRSKYDFTLDEDTRNTAQTADSSGRSSDSPSKTTEVSQTDLIEEIQRLHSEIGDYVVNSRSLEHGRYSLNDYVTEFGSWSDALSAAGIDRKAIILEDIAGVWRDLGERPTTSQMNEHSDLGKSIYTTEFETWGDALAECRATYDAPTNTAPEDAGDTAETEPSSKSDEGSSESPSREALLSDLNRLDEQLDHMVKATDLPEHSEFPHYQFREEFGSWDDALAAAGIDKEAVLLDEIQRLQQELGRFPSTSDMNEYGMYSAGIYNRFFGSWGEVITLYEQSGEIPESGTNSEGDSHADDDCSPRDEPDPTKAELIAELNRLHAEIGNKIANSRYVNEDGAFSLNDYIEAFGSWNEALTAAGIDRKAVFLEELARVWRVLGSEPTTAEMRRHGDLGAGLYSQEFGSWGDAKDRCRREFDVPVESPDQSPHSGDEVTDEDGRASRLAEDISDRLATINDVAASARLDRPILVRILSAPDGTPNRKSHDIRVEDISGETFSLVIWTVHDVDVNWTEGHWYLLRESLGKVWERNETTHRQLSSTRDLDVTDVGPSLSEASLQELLTAAPRTLNREINTGNDENSKTDAGEDSGDQSELVDSLMEDLDL